MDETVHVLPAPGRLRAGLEGWRAITAVTAATGHTLVVPWYSLQAQSTSRAAPGAPPAAPAGAPAAAGTSSTMWSAHGTRRLGLAYLCRVNQARAQTVWWTTHFKIHKL